MLDKVLVQDAEDRERWGRIGAPRDRIEVAGSIKFDLEGAATADPERVAALSGDRCSISTAVMAAARRSAAPGAAGRKHACGRGAFSGQGLPEAEGRDARSVSGGGAPAFREERRRGGEARRLGLVASRRSQWDEAAKSFGGEGEANTDGTAEPGDDLRCLVDRQQRENLRDWYHLADLVVIGKSFLSTGGQNPVEAIAAGKPVFFGPHMENFDVACETTGRGARRRAGIGCGRT